MKRIWRCFSFFQELYPFFNHPVSLNQTTINLRFKFVLTQKFTCTDLILSNAIVMRVYPIVQALFSAIPSIKLYKFNTVVFDQLWDSALLLAAKKFMNLLYAKLFRYSKSICPEMAKADPILSQNWVQNGRFNKKLSFFLKSCFDVKWGSWDKGLFFFC